MMKMSDINLAGIPTAQCICGCSWFTLHAVIDSESYEISAYSTEATCFSCGILLTVATPVDLLGDN
jgi:hypothetical protein